MRGGERRHRFLLCRTCLHRWWHDTESGRDDRPAPLPGTAAA
ncbi:hypothetical protein ACVGOW_18635 [Pseudonocardia saturnea]